MPRVCQVTGARTTVGRKYRYRGKAKYLGGIGKKVTSAEKRTIKPNLQSVTTMIEGRPVRMRVKARIIKQGMIVKPLKRKYVYQPKKA
jgi:large subunit ribosomal protein L28